MNYEKRQEEAQILKKDLFTCTEALSTGSATGNTEQQSSSSLQCFSPEKYEERRCQKQRNEQDP